MAPGGLAAVGSAPIGVDMEAVRTGGESSDRAADTQGRQVGPLFQFQATANSVSYSTNVMLSLVYQINRSNLQ